MPIESAEIKCPACAASRTEDVEPRRVGEQRRPKSGRPQHVSTEGELLVPAIHYGPRLGPRSLVGSVAPGAHCAREAIRNLQAACRATSCLAGDCEENLPTMRAREPAKALERIAIGRLGNKIQDVCRSGRKGDRKRNFEMEGNPHVAIEKIHQSVRHVPSAASASGYRSFATDERTSMAGHQWQDVVDRFHETNHIGPSGI